MEQVPKNRLILNYIEMKNQQLAAAVKKSSTVFSLPVNYETNDSFHLNGNNAIQQQQQQQQQNQDNK